MDDPVPPRRQQPPYEVNRCNCPTTQRDRDAVGVLDGQPAAQGAGLWEPLRDRSQVVGAGEYYLELLQACLSLPVRASSLALPGVQPEVVVIAVDGEESGSDLGEVHRDVEAQLRMIELDRPFQVGHPEVHVPYPRSTRERDRVGPLPRSELSQQGIEVQRAVEGGEPLVPAGSLRQIFQFGHTLLGLSA